MEKKLEKIDGTKLADAIGSLANLGLIKVDGSLGLKEQVVSLVKTLIDLPLDREDDLEECVFDAIENIYAAVGTASLSKTLDALTKAGRASRRATKPAKPVNPPIEEDVLESPAPVAEETAGEEVAEPAPTAADEEPEELKPLKKAKATPGITKHITEIIVRNPGISKQEIKDILDKEGAFYKDSTLMAEYTSVNRIIRALADCGLIKFSI